MIRAAGSPSNTSQAILHSLIVWQWLLRGSLQVLCTNHLLTEVVESLVIDSTVRALEGICVALLHLLLDKPDDRV